MDIIRIKYFHVVTETRHIREASEILGITAGSLSKAIKTLEDEIGFPLLQASGRRIEITPRGLDFYYNSKKLLEEYDQLKGRISEEPPAISPKIRLGTFEVFSTYLFADVLAKEFPEERFRLQELTPGHIEDAIIKNQIDYGLTYLPLPQEGLDFIKLGSFEMKIFGKKKFFKTEFSELPFAIPTTPVQSPATPFQSLDGWPQEKFPRFVKYEFEMLETALLTTQKGASVLYCPDFVVRLHNEQSSGQLEEIPSPGGFKKDRRFIYLIKRKNEPENAFTKKVARYIRTHF
ncbi:LysR family transcriptional regulator [Bdellovibrio bacteriovorus]|uniref:LysR family transcriptional regulator n=1 Tax=Bdellovibrio TaxID=958 RepID=UPI0035A8F113